MPTDLADFLQRVGLPTGLVILFGLALWRGVWPFFTEKIWPFIMLQVERWNEERAAERKRLLAEVDDLARERSQERAQYQGAISAADLSRQEERERFMRLYAEQTAAIKSNNQQVVEAFSELTGQIRSLHDSEAANTREILKVISEIAVRNKRQ